MDADALLRGAPLKQPLVEQLLEERQKGLP